VAQFQVVRDMNHLTTLASPMLKIISKICPIILRRYYTKDKLDSFLRFDIPSSGDGVTYNFHAQEGSCWMVATNLSPFDFTVDRMDVLVVFEGSSFSCTNIIPHPLKNQSTDRIPAKGKSPILAEAAQFAKKNTKNVRVEIAAYIVSTIHSFDVKRIISDVKNFQLLV
jgi:hypothetical protein